MYGDMGHRGGIGRYPRSSESASSQVNGARYQPGLVTGELVHICEACV